MAGRPSDPAAIDEFLTTTNPALTVADAHVTPLEWAAGGGSLTAILSAAACPPRDGTTEGAAAEKPDSRLTQS